MAEEAPSMPSVAIVDYGMGNLYSVERACEEAGMTARITSSAAEILRAGAVILPGVGAFPDAMARLHRLDLVSVLRDIVQSAKPLVGICLGMQLLMSESEEFSNSKGLGVLPGTVRWIRPELYEGRQLKVPEVGWNSIHRPRVDGAGWERTLLRGLENDTFMYFVHSLVVQPEEGSVCLAMTRYGTVEFCSALKDRNVFGCQFHPERSGHAGLKIYRNIHSLITDGTEAL